MVFLGGLLSGAGLALTGGVAVAWPGRRPGLPGLASLVVVWGAALLLVAFAAGVGTAPGTVSGDPTRAALGALTFWVVVGVLLPALAPTAVDAFLPAPDPASVEQACKRMERDREEEIRRALARHPDLPPMEAWLEAGGDGIHRRYREAERRLRGALERRIRSCRRTVRVVSNASPPAAFARAVRELAGVGEARRERVGDRFRAQMVRVRAFVVALVWRRAGEEGFDAETHLDFSSLARALLVNLAPSPGTGLARAAPLLGWLLFTAAGAILAAGLAGILVDPRPGGVP